MSENIFYNLHSVWIFGRHFQTYFEDIFHRLSYLVMQLRPLMTSLSMSGKGFPGCSYPVPLIQWGRPCICVVWLSRLAGSFQPAPALPCTWRIMLGAVLHNSRNDACLAHFERCSCDCRALVLCRGHTSGSGGRLGLCACIFDI